MSITSRLQEFRIDTLSIIADPQPKEAFAVRDFRFDFACLCVVERISQRFARNAINIVAEDRMQVSRCALYRNVELRRAPPATAGAGELFTQSGHGLGQI